MKRVHSNHDYHCPSKNNRIDDVGHLIFVTWIRDLALQGTESPNTVFSLETVLETRHLVLTETLMCSCRLRPNLLV